MCRLLKGQDIQVLLNVLTLPKRMNILSVLNILSFQERMKVEYCSMIMKGIVQCY